MSGDYQSPHLIPFAPIRTLLCLHVRRRQLDVFVAPSLGAMMFPVNILSIDTHVICPTIKLHGFGT